MIKAFALGVSNGRPLRLILLGLSRRNCNLLLEGRPIKVTLTDLSPDSPIHELLIMGGETEEEMMKELQSHVGPETEVTVTGVAPPGRDA
ncbi:MAG TPA: hypothetical protein VMK12_04980 [Anaeromyxobacteraceae bacterium]|nr:hypothetical protein [Anaeromyxobacteraceae bacterium]